MIIDSSLRRYQHVITTYLNSSIVPMKAFDCVLHLLRLSARSEPPNNSVTIAKDRGYIYPTEKSEPSSE